VVGKTPYRRKGSYPPAIALVALVVAFVGVLVAAELVSKTFAAQLGSRAPAVVGASARAAWIDPRRAVPRAFGYDWHCFAPSMPAGGLAHSTFTTNGTRPKPVLPTCPAAESRALSALNLIAIAGLIVTFAATLAIVIVGTAVQGRAAARARRRAPPKPPKIDPDRAAQHQPFVLYVGRSTGSLLEIGHGAGISANQPVALVDDDACQNVVIYGGIGSGKTTSGINRFLDQSLRQDCGGLIFDVKGDYGLTVHALASAIGRPIDTIGINGRPFNLLAGLTPEIAASFLKSAFLLSGNTGANSVIFVDTAVNLSRNVLGMLSAFPERYSLRGLYEAVFDETARKWLRDATIERLSALKESDQLAYNRLFNYFSYVKTIFPAFDVKIKQGAHTQLSQILDAFQLEEIDRAFCRAGDNAVSMDEVMDGRVFLLDLPISIYGLSAKTVYTLVKLRFFNTVQKRRTSPTWNQSRPLVFLCDEYQQVVSVAPDALSDLNFWDTSRSAKCVGIISAQGFESFQSVIGSPSLTASLLQNFRQQICFRTEDPTTIKRFTYLLGKVSVLHTSSSSTMSSNQLGASRGRATQQSLREEDVITPQTFRNLPRGRALALLSIAGEAYDDVLTMDFLSPKLSEAATAKTIPSSAAATTTVA